MVLVRGPESVYTAANRARHRSIKRSAGLARDLHLAYSGMFAEEKPARSAQYCVKVAPSQASSTSASTPATFPTTSASAEVPIATGGTNATSPFKLAQSYEGSTFFNGWSFFSYADPTAGTVQYVDSGIAQSGNLTEINSAGNAVMRVDTTPQITSGFRKSVRIQTNFSYNVGTVMIMDSVHMPTGCGTWPAFWSNGPNWPAGGEIDIVEGVNTYTNNQATLHTNAACTLPSNNSSTLGIAGGLVGGTDCSVADTGDAGCGIRASDPTSFGAPFNNVGGGVYAMQWLTSGISVHFFPRSAIPADITAGVLQPSTWGMPMASFPASSCNPSTSFYDHSAIFDTTLCGAWAGTGWYDTSAPGQSVSCAVSTGTSSCEAYVQNNGAAFSEAYWEVKSVKIYELSS
ncbi:Probable glycosidase [Sparassis crispa]|uniref:Probable glycosidase n=1 Tax=Sparassis crispa TaxID=139825 RepID=A0A401G8L2_9APHY|nr:Probable glycosidase [Sparassis crispa]GBE78520.1 Probable glycosidase [Sparassis crispa]